MKASSFDGFRGCATLCHLLSTLHDGRYRTPCKTRFQLAGCALAGRESNPLDRYERFQLISSPSPGLSLAQESLGCEVELVDRVMEDDPIDLWMSEFYAGVGTRLKTMFGDQSEPLDSALAEMLSGALDQTLQEYWTPVFRRYGFRERMRRFMQRGQSGHFESMHRTGQDTGGRSRRRGRSARTGSASS